MSELRVEEWRPIAGWSGYEVSNHGRVRRDGRFLKPVPVQQGRSDKYKPFYVSLSNGPRIKKFKIAELVLRQFVGLRPHGHWARHYDDDQSNNYLDNLSWGTPKQNGEDRARNGRSTPGSRNGNSVLTEDRVLKIRSEYVRQSKTHGLRALGEQYGCSLSTIHLILKRTIWTHV